MGNRKYVTACGWYVGFPRSGNNWKHENVNKLLI